MRFLAFLALTLPAAPAIAGKGGANQTPRPANVVMGDLPGDPGYSMRWHGTSVLPQAPGNPETRRQEAAIASALTKTVYCPPQRAKHCAKMTDDPQFFHRGWGMSIVSLEVAGPTIIADIQVRPVLTRRASPDNGELAGGRPVCLERWRLSGGKLTLIGFRAGKDDPNITVYHGGATPLPRAAMSRGTPPPPQPRFVPPGRPAQKDDEIILEPAAKP